MIINGTEIPKNDPRYIVPYTEHGMASKSKDPIYFEIGAYRCVNSTTNTNSCLIKEISTTYLFKQII